MFRPEPMLKVELLCLTSEVQEVALLLARHGGFGPAAPARAGRGDGHGETYRELYREAAARMAKIQEYCGRHEAAPIPDDAVAPSERELAGIGNRLREIWQACSGCREKELRVEEEKRRFERLRETYVRLSALSVDPERLLRHDGLLDIRLGQVPAVNLKRLGEALSVAGYVLTVFDRAGDQAFVVAVGPRAEPAGGGRLGGLLGQAGWRDLPVPAELRHDPESSARWLETEGRRLDAMVAEHCELRERHWRQYSAWLGQARVLLALARPLAESSSLGLSAKGQLAVFSGWVPKRAEAALRDALEARFRGRCLMSARAPEPGESATVPSLLRHPFWLRPFATLVRHYGVPRYGEFDPTLLFAAGYVLLFGAMFGDVGHGAVLLAGALFLGGRLAWLRWVGMAAALSSIGFGLLYGSVFGYEDLIEPVWQSPLHDPARMLWLALAAGAVFIAVTLAINLYNRLIGRRWLAALLAGDGLAGLGFYAAVAAGLFGALEGVATTLAWVVAGVCLGAVALGVALETPGPAGERLVVAVIEAMEAAVNLFANTLSFLRVAAFSMNHVALALAVFAVAAGLEGIGHGAALLLGNAVIIVLEGAIVAIQALRLMYYEGFSRFFAGDGFEFRPLRLSLDEVQAMSRSEA